MIKHATFRTAWGWMSVAVSARGVTALVLPRTTRTSAERSLKTVVSGAKAATDGHEAPPDALVEAAKEQVIQFLDGRRRSFECPVDLTAGTDFQRRVWRAITAIPYGRVRSYQWVARRVGGAQHARAVGNALGANPIPLIVPCHRVVTSAARLGGFSGGLHNKRRLLALEGTLRQLETGRRGT